MSNIVAQYRRTGYLWEQYDDATGEFGAAVSGVRGTHIMVGRVGLGWPPVTTRFAGC